MEGYSTYRHIRAGCIGIAIVATSVRCSTEAVMARDELLVEWSCRSRRPRICVVGSLYSRPAERRQRVDCYSVIGSTNPRSGAAATRIPRHRGDRRRRIRVGAVYGVVALREG